MKEELFEVEIEKMSLGGNGIARLQGDSLKGLVLFVPFSAPGDLLQVRITEKKKSFAFAEIVQILKASPWRRAAPCPVYERCGGCNFQHLQYPEQLRQKQQIVLEHLSRLVTKDTEIFTISASSTEWHYRNRIQLHFENEGFGFRQRRSHDVVPIQDCLIAEESLIQYARGLKNIKSPQRLQVFLKEDLSVSHFQDRDDQGELMGFSQVNRFQNENLVRTALAWAEGSFVEIWDLYAGAGNFSFPLMSSHRKSIFKAVELSSASVQQAQEKLRKLNLSPVKVQFLLADVAAFLRRAVLPDQSLIFLDPPRDGCASEVIENIASRNFEKILYVSCNPSTLARDLQLLFKKSLRPLKIQRLQAFDMFPQTDHVECLVEVTVDRST